MKKTTNKCQATYFKDDERNDIETSGIPMSKSIGVSSTVPNATGVEDCEAFACC